MKNFKLGRGGCVPIIEKICIFSQPLKKKCSLPYMWKAGFDALNFPIIIQRFPKKMYL
jgi:hypothetical protein